MQKNAIPKEGYDQMGTLRVKLGNLFKRHQPVNLKVCCGKEREKVEIYL